LRTRAIELAACLLEMVLQLAPKAALAKAGETLRDGSAWRKFEAICNAQGGLRTPPEAAFTHPVLATDDGPVTSVDNRVLAKIAKLAGAPSAKAAGLVFHAPIGTQIERGMPLYTVHAETRGELAYALEFVHTHPGVIRLGPRA